VPYALAFSMAAISALLFWLSLLMFRKRTI